MSTVTKPIILNETGVSIKEAILKVAEVQEKAIISQSAVTTLNAAIEALKSGKVDKDGNKQLSTEDFTTAEKQKLAELSTTVSADSTKLETIETTLEDKANKDDIPEAQTDASFDSFLDDLFA